MLNPTKCDGMTPPRAGRASTCSVASAARARAAPGAASSRSAVSSTAARVLRRDPWKIAVSGRSTAPALPTGRHSCQVVHRPRELLVVAGEADHGLVVVDHPDDGRLDDLDLARQRRQAHDRDAVALLEALRLVDAVAHAQGA